MPAWPIALACWVLPTLVVFICYGISISLDQVPRCVPFFEGCTSISAASRQQPSLHLFRAVMLPTTALLLAYWLIARTWLGLLGARGPARAWMTLLGIIGAVFLVFYAVFLGTDGPAYELMRRYGVTVYFAFTALAQILLSAQLQRLPGHLPDVGRRLPAVKVGFGAAMLVIGLVNIPAANFFDADPVENVVEWNFALLMHGYFGLTALAWYRGGLIVALQRG